MKNLKKYIRNGNELFIDKKNWQDINVNYSKLYGQLHPGPLFPNNLNESEIEDLKEKIRNEKRIIKAAISDAIDGLPLPLLPINEQEAKEDFDNLVIFSKLVPVNIILHPKPSRCFAIAPPIAPEAPVIKTILFLNKGPSQVAQ